MEKKLTLSRPWTTAPAAVRAETRVYSGQYIGYAMFWRQRVTPTGVSDMPVFASPYKIERFRKRQRSNPDRYISNTAQATAILVRVEPS
ncbi:unnamed protein product [Bathycoccus prasinos]